MRNLNLNRRATPSSGFSLKMSQHIPSVSRADVERIAARDFPPHQVPQVLKALSFYGTESYHREVDRVHLDILKLVAGEFNQIAQETENACFDYRDTMVAAEYPNYGRKMFGIDKLPPAQRKCIIDADKGQYEAWLSRKTNQGEQGAAPNP